MDAEWGLAAVFVGSFLLTGLLRLYAPTQGLMDVPNARSSHTLPTPRAGGLAVVVSFLASLPLLLREGALASEAAVALVGACGWVALVGLCDDFRHVPARWRLSAHFAGVGWALTWLGGPPPLSFLGVTVDVAWLGIPLAAISLAWLLNLYNFMDGINGIACVQAVTVCLAAVLLYWWREPAGHEWLAPALLASSTGGFLLWNFPTAKIFLGDVGSGFLGVTLGIFAVQAGWLSSDLLWAWVVLLGVFVVDATVTLLRRMKRAERLDEPHRTHAYQRAARRHGHVPVTLAVGVINLGWLTPLALLVGLGHLDGLTGVLVAYAPLVWMTWWYEAGMRESADRSPELPGGNRQ